MAAVSGELPWHSSSAAGLQDAWAATATAPSAITRSLDGETGLSAAGRMACGPLEDVPVCQSPAARGVLEARYLCWLR